MQILLVSIVALYCLTAGFTIAWLVIDLRNRKAVMAACEKKNDDLAKLLETVNLTHNSLVKQATALAEKVGTLEMKLAGAAKINQGASFGRVSR